ncbi:MAG: 6-phospho-beta-glucosidase [Anaerolineales bacterium]|nr:6-phospho-beta-glucosidase [Anaerolineales bacterium]
MKITVIGGGSTYTPELVSGFLARLESLPLRELWLMDIDAQRLEIVGGFARRMVAAAGAPFEVVLSDERRAAIQGASYVIAQLRVGQMAARRQDEYLGKRHGLVGQETTGVGGFAKALRTIPVLLGVASEMQELAPYALLVNFTNPAGLVVEALQRHAPGVPSVGVCNAPLTTVMRILERLEQRMGAPIDPRRAQLDTLGLNHLTWQRGFRLDGQEIWPQVLGAYLEELRASPALDFEPRLVESLGMIPNYYLEYFYHTDRKLAAQSEWPPSRAEEVIEIEKRLLELYAEPGRRRPPEELMQRGGAYYSTAATQLLAAHHNDLGERHVLNTRHGGAVPGWPEDWVLELPCCVDRDGVHPLPARPLPPACFGLLAAVKSYELLAVQAAVQGDRQAAYQALLVHPLGPPADRIQAVLDDLLQTHRAYLLQFWPGG